MIIVLKKVSDIEDPIWMRFYFHCTTRLKWAVISMRYVFASDSSWHFILANSSSASMINKVLLVVAYLLISSHITFTVLRFSTFANQDSWENDMMSSISLSVIFIYLFLMLWFSPQMQAFSHWIRLWDCSPECMVLAHRQFLKHVSRFI